MKNRNWKLFLGCLFSLFFLTGCDAESKLPQIISETEETDSSSDTLEEAAIKEPLPFHILPKKLTVPGLQKEYTFLFLSDTHVIELNGTESDKVMENALPRIELFKDIAGISSAERFPEWIDYANEKEVDMVLFGGDIIDFPSEGNLKLLKENTDKLSMPFVFTLGNHDWTYPWDYMTVEGRNTYRPLFHDLTDGNPAASVTEYEELVILSVDNSSNQLDAAALAVTDEALSLNKPVLVIAHVPFSTESLLKKAHGIWNSPVSIGMADEGGIFPDANTLAFQKKILAANSPVFCILSGHVHFSDESALTDSVVQIVNGTGYTGEGVLLQISGN